MKKRIFIFALALLMLVSLAACGKKQPTTYELVSDALKNIKALDESDMDIDMDISVTVMGATVDTPVKMSVQSKGLTKGDPIAYVNMKMTVMGTDILMEMYTEDGYVYTSTMGQNFKTKAEEADMGYADSDMYEGVLQEIPREILETSAAVTENEDGSKTIEVEFTPEQFQKVYADLVGDMSESMSESMEIKSLNISECKVSLTVDKDGYISVYDVAFVLDMTVMVQGISTTAQMDLEMRCQYNDPGKPVTVKTIEGYKNFPEVDLGEIQ